MELERGRPWRGAARSDGDGTYPIVNPSERCSPSCLAYFSVMRARTSASGVVAEMRSSTMASCRMTLTVKVSKPLTLDVGLAGVKVSEEGVGEVDGES